MRSSHLSLILCLSLAACLHGCSADVNHAANCDNLLAKAMSLASEKDYKQEQQCLTEALAEAGKSQYPWQKARVLKEMINNYLAQDDAKNAESAGRALIQDYDATPLDGTSRSNRMDMISDRGHARMMLAEALAKQKRYDEALQVMRQAKEEAARNLGDFEMQEALQVKYLDLLRASGKTASAEKEDYDGDAWSNLNAHDASGEGGRLRTAGQVKQAIDVYKKAQQLAIAAKSDKGFVETTLEVAVTELVDRNLPAARAELAKIADSRALEKMKPRVKSRFLTVSAVAAQNKAEAMKDYDQAKQLDTHDAEVQLRAILGARHDKVDNRLFLFGRALPIMSKRDRFEFMTSLLELCKKDASAHSKAVQFFLSQANDPSVSADEHALSLELAAIVLRHDQPAQAEKLTRQALAIREHIKADDIEKIPEAQYFLCQDYILTHNAKRAISIADAALAALAQSPEHEKKESWIAYLNYLLGDAYVAEHQYEKATAAYDKAMTLPRKADWPEDIEKKRDEAAKLAHSHSDKRSAH